MGEVENPAEAILLSIGKSWLRVVFQGPGLPCPLVSAMTQVLDARSPPQGHKAPTRLGMSLGHHPSKVGFPL